MIDRQEKQQTGRSRVLWQILCIVPFIMDWIQIVGLFGGICTASSMLPQLIKTVKEKKAEDISKKMLIVLMIGVATWLVYGILRKDLPIIITNSFSLVLNISMLVLRIKYSRSADRQAARNKEQIALQ
jgi:MtN3 and saliva related transmembrane protein